MKVVGKQRNSRMCFVCGMDNASGLKAQFYNMEDGSVITPFQYDSEHQSFPLRVHGGLVATMLDELGLRAMWTKSGEEVFGVTMSLEIKYRKPVPYNIPLTGRGLVIKETPKFATIHSEIYDSNGIILAEGIAKYIKLDTDQIVRGIDSHEEMCYLLEDDRKDLPLPADRKAPKSSLGVCASVQQSIT